MAAAPQYRLGILQATQARQAMRLGLDNTDNTITLCGT
ncbi:protein of unknown function (plasmid) [Cupriavidus taiwanensis]|uniref:Uncharacterized protein n=1 Tax=Cupriavidus taiwanensis TaxID=164546 RepID=A0A375IU45_9BURK|nr:protein of unknown function [Cupriavidus taiwanensis]